jgi:hypothetical protein
MSGTASIGHEQNGEQHDDALLDGKLDQAFEHENLPVEGDGSVRAFSVLIQ